VSEAISNALGRAQNLTFTIFSAALIVWLVALTTISENTNALARLSAEFDDVSKVAVHGDNVIREIRRYLINRTADDLTERQALRKVQHAFSKSVALSGDVSSVLVGSGRRDLLSVTQAINVELEDLRRIHGAIISVNVDLSPQSVALIGQLEDISLQDLIVLAHLVSVDPIALHEILAGFQALPPSQDDSAAFGARMTGLSDLLGAANQRSRNARFHQAEDRAVELRKASEAFARSYGHLAPGGLQSTFSVMRARLRDLEDKRGPIRDRLAGNFQINVPLISQSFPVTLLTLLFPLALIGGYGLVATSLLFAKRKILTITLKPSRRSSADSGFIFDQLGIGKPHTRVANWALLVTMSLLPWIAAVWLMIRFGGEQSALLQMINFVQIGLGFLIFLSIVDTSREISREVRW